MLVLIVLCVLCAVSLIFNLLTLACSARNALDQRQAVAALTDGLNIVARRVSDLVGNLDSALDCLLTLDATAADSLAEVDAAE